MRVQQLLFTCKHILFTISGLDSDLISVKLKLYFIVFSGVAFVLDWHKWNQHLVLHICNSVVYIKMQLISSAPR